MERRVFMKLRRLAALTGALALLGFSGCIPDFMMPKARKPVLYLYPPEETTVTVSLSGWGADLRLSGDGGGGLDGYRPAGRCSCR